MSFMRRLVTGLDAQGHSCVLEEITFPRPGDAPPMDLIHQTLAAPPPARPRGRAPLVDLQVPPGIARWILVQFQPGSRSPMHHTDTVDFDTIIDGSVDILLDDGPHHLEPGDCVVVTGVDHGWQAGPQGCTSSVVLIGTPPRAPRTLGRRDSRQGPPALSSRVRLANRAFGRSRGAPMRPPLRCPTRTRRTARVR